MSGHKEKEEEEEEKEQGRMNNQPNVNMREKESLLSCPVCLEDIVDEGQLKELHCTGKHKICKDCLSQWAEQAQQDSKLPTCPECRYDIPLKELADVFQKTSTTHTGDSSGGDGENGSKNHHKSFLGLMAELATKRDYFFTHLSPGHFAFLFNGVRVTFVAGTMSDIHWVDIQIALRPFRLSSLDVAKRCMSANRTMGSATAIPSWFAANERDEVLFINRLDWQHITVDCLVDHVERCIVQMSEALHFEVGEEAAKNCFLQEEEENIQAQKQAGNMVFKRIIGNPGSVYHNISDRTLSILEGFPTIAAPESVTVDGSFYYELEILEVGGCAQFGFMLGGEGLTLIDMETGDGTGDNDKSWAVDGYRKALWHNRQEHTGFECEWKKGDIVGLAVNIEQGEIAVSNNGSYSSKTGQGGCGGVVFESESIKSCGVFPAISAGIGTKVRYAVLIDDFKFGPPTAAVWEEECLSTTIVSQSSLVEDAVDSESQDPDTRSGTC